MSNKETGLSLATLQNMLSEQWSNNSCLGYLIVALEDLGYTEKAIQDIVLATQSTFNSMTTKEAADYYCHSKF